MDIGVINEKKQKMHHLEDILSSFCDNLKTRKKKDSIFKTYVVKYYEALICLPYPFQPGEALKWIKQTKISGIDTNKLIFSDREKKAVAYISEIALKKPDFKEESDFLKKCISEEKKEIADILKSKRFKLARSLTKKNEHLPLCKYSKYIK